MIYVLLFINVLLTVNMWRSGPAALVCAETLRQNSYEGRIIMVTKDNLSPFDKPKLSKVWNMSKWRGVNAPVRQSAFCEKAFLLFF